MNVIAFPRPHRADATPCGDHADSLSHAERLRGIEQCLKSLSAEADEMGLDLLAHMIDVAREAAVESRAEVRVADRRRGTAPVAP